jgi:hypothetical protein
MLTFGVLGSAMMWLGGVGVLAADRNAIVACQVAASAEGQRDVTALQSLVQQVSSAAAQSTEAEVRRSGAALGRSARIPNLVRLQSALRTFRETCRRTVGATAAKAHEVPEAEFDRQLERVLERTGERDASCDKQRFGGGWAAVCE